MNQHFVEKPAPRTDLPTPSYRTCPICRKAKDLVGWLDLRYVPRNPRVDGSNLDTSG